MKHGTLRAIGHNMADSLASGICLMIGYYDVDVFGEAERSQNGTIVVDFLNGTVTDGEPSDMLVNAVLAFRDALEGLCKSHGVAVSAFHHLSAKFWSEPTGQRFSVTVEDERGRRTTTEYGGIPGKRLKVFDHLGRLRPKPLAA